MQVLITRIKGFSSTTFSIFKNVIYDIDNMTQVQNLMWACLTECHTLMKRFFPISISHHQFTMQPNERRQIKIYVCVIMAFSEVRGMVAFYTQQHYNIYGTMPLCCIERQNNRIKDTMVSIFFRHCKLMSILDQVKAMISNTFKHLVENKKKFKHFQRFSRVSTDPVLYTFQIRMKLNIHSSFNQVLMDIQTVYSLCNGVSTDIQTDKGSAYVPTTFWQ